MHGTRTTAKILVGAAMAALTGCVAVDKPDPARPAPAPSPAAETVRPAQDVAPQIVEGPAREALEAALPAPPPSPTAAPPRRAPGRGPAERAAPQSAERPEAARPSPVQKRRAAPRPAAAPNPAVPPLPPGLDRLGKELPHKPPTSRAEVCELGERYGGWSPASEQARICRGTYG